MQQLLLPSLLHRPRFFAHALWPCRK